MRDSENGRRTVRARIALLLIALVCPARADDEPAPAYGAAPKWHPDPNWAAHHPRRGTVLHVLTQFDDIQSRRHPEALASALSEVGPWHAIPPIAAPDWTALARFAADYNPRVRSSLRVLAQSGCKPVDFGYPCRARVLGLYASPALLQEARAEFPWTRPVPAPLPTAAEGVYAKVAFLEGPWRGDELIVPAYLLTRLIPPDDPLPRLQDAPRTASTDALMTLARRLEALGRREPAADAYLRALVIDPATPGAGPALERLGGRVPLLTPDVYQVVDVLDERTFLTTIHGEQRAVRLLGLRSPDSPGDTIEGPPRAIRGVAAARLHALLSHQSVRLELPNGEAADPLPAYVYRVADGLDVSREMIDSGHAFADLADDHPRRDEFRQAAEVAESRGLGMWKPAPDPLDRLPGPAPRSPGLRVTPARIDPGGTAVRPSRPR